MGKEFKIGIAVVGTLAIAFGAVLYQRVNKLKTTPAVAKNEKPGEKLAADADKLFAATNQLATRSGSETDGDAEPADRGGFKWNSKPAEQEAAPAENATVEAAPPRASFLPSEEPATDDRYGSRYADASAAPSAEEPAAADTATTDPPAEEAPIGRIVADSPSEMATEAATPKSDVIAAPSSVANPFARATPAAEPAMDEPLATTPAEAQPSTDAVAADETIGAVEQPGPIAIRQPSDEPAQPTRPARPEPAEISIADEPAPPARLDTRAVPTGAISESPRPASRFIATEEESPPAGASSRYSDSFSPPAVAAPARVSARSIAGGTYRLGPNENFWTVSEQAYGTGGYFKALHAYNAERHPIADDLAVGDEVNVPEKSELERQFPELCPKPGRRSTRDSYAIQASARMKASGETYVVQEGDTLFDIARYELGKAARWAELYDLNRSVIGDDIDFLRPGMELILPNEGDRPDSVTRQPGGSLR